MKKLLMFATVLAITMSFSVVRAGERLNGAGATFPYPIYSAWAYDYNKTTGVQVNYQSIGSGGGQRQIVEKTIDFGASDDPLTPEKLAKDKLLQFPAIVGGVVPVVHIEGIKAGHLKLDAETLCRIFLGEIKKWDDPKISGLNKGINLPKTEIVVIHRSDGSGTTSIFTNYLAGTCADWKNRVGEGKSVKWPVGIGGKGNEGVANYVKMTANSIGYVEFAYAKQNKLNHTQLKNKAGNSVEPSFDSFEAAADSGNFDAKQHFHTWLNNTPGKTSWPIAGATFILMSREKKDSNMKTVKFFDWAFKNGDTKAKELTYVPIPKSLKDKVRAYWKANGLQ